jgi:hypothetical protein
LLKQKVAQNVAISLGYFIFSKAAQLAKKLTQSGHFERKESFHFLISATK